MIPREDSKSDIRTTKEISYNISNEKPRTTFPLHLAQNFITSAKQRERTTPLQIDNRTGVDRLNIEQHTHTHQIIQAVILNRTVRPLTFFPGSTTEI